MFALVFGLVLTPTVVAPAVAPPPPQVPTAGLPRQVHPPANVRPWTPPPPPDKKDRP